MISMISMKVIDGRVRFSKPVRRDGTLMTPCACAGAKDDSTFYIAPNQGRLTIYYDCDLVSDDQARGIILRAARDRAADDVALLQAKLGDAYVLKDILDRHIGVHVNT